MCLVSCCIEPWRLINTLQHIYGPFRAALPCFLFPDWTIFCSIAQFLVLTITTYFCKHLFIPIFYFFSPSIFLSISSSLFLCFSLFLFISPPLSFNTSYVNRCFPVRAGALQRLTLFTNNASIKALQT